MPKLSKTKSAKAPTPVVSAPPPAPVEPAAKPVPTKSETVIKLLSRARGATMAELGAATDWQPHSIRAFLSGLRKKGSVLVKETRKTGEAAHRIGTGGYGTALSGTNGRSAGTTRAPSREVVERAASRRVSEAVIQVGRRRRQRTP